MNIKRTLFIKICIALIFSFTISAAQAKSNPHHLSKFQKDYAHVIKVASKEKSFSVNFVQESYSVLRDKVTISDGTLAVHKPNAFRYEITRPHPELYVTNGTDFWKYNSEFQHAQHLPAYTGELNFLTVLMDLSHLKKFYKIAPWTEAEAKKLNQVENITPVMSDQVPSQKNGNILLKLVPKGDNQQKVLYAIIKVTTGFLQELRIVQLNGNRIRFVFSKYSTEPLTPEIFDFQPPAGTAVDGGE